jgi:hypothetical protein
MFGVLGVFHAFMCAHDISPQSVDRDDGRTACGAQVPLRHSPARPASLNN